MSIKNFYLAKSENYKDSDAIVLSDAVILNIEEKKTVKVTIPDGVVNVYFGASNNFWVSAETITLAAPGESKQLSNTLQNPGLIKLDKEPEIYITVDEPAIVTLTFYRNPNA